MHSAVMQNKKYVKFAAENTVEVLALGRLDEAIEKLPPDDKRIATYEKVGPDGKTAKYMVQWPSLTLEQILGLRRSKASSYNNTGGIPHTAVVDPHTLEAVKTWSGSQSSKTIQDAVTDVIKDLRKQHGTGISRRTIRYVDHTVASASALAEKGDYKKALKEIEKVAKQGSQWPEVLTGRLAESRTQVLASANAKLDEIEALEGGDKKRALNRMRGKVRGTELEARVKEMLESL